MKIKILALLMAVSALLVACSPTETESATDTVGTETASAETTAAPSDKETDGETKAPVSGADPVTEALDTYGAEWSFASLSQQILASDEDWSVSGTGQAGGLTYFGEYAGAKPHGSVFDIASLNYAGDEEKYRFDLELWTPESGDPLDAPADISLFVGLRLQDLSATAADPRSGIWLSFKGGSMGVVGADISDTVTFSLPYGFEEGFRRICIEDDQRKNTVSVWIESGEGEKQLAFCLQLSTDGESTVIDVYSYTDGFAEPSARVSKGKRLMYGGYVKLWNNNKGEVYLKNIAYRVFE